MINGSRVIRFFISLPLGYLPATPNFVGNYPWTSTPLPKGIIKLSKGDLKSALGFGLR